MIQKKTWYKWTYLQKRKRVADLENKLTAARVGWKGMGEGVVRELGVDMYTLLYFKWIANKNSLYSTENSAQCCVTAWMVGSFRENGSMHVYGWVPLLSTWNCHNVVNWPSVQFSCCCVRLFATPWTTARQASLPITNSQSLLKLMSIESVMPSSHLILCHPLLLLPPIILKYKIKSLNK